MAISSSTIAGAVLVAAGSVALCTPWMDGNRSAGPRATTITTRIAECAPPPSAANAASGQSLDAWSACAAGIAAMYPNATWEAFARGFPR